MTETDETRGDDGTPDGQLSMILSDETLSEQTAESPEGTDDEPDHRSPDAPSNLS